MEVALFTLIKNFFLGSLSVAHYNDPLAAAFFALSANAMALAKLKVIN